MRPVDEKLPADVRLKVWVANHFKHILVFSLALALLSVGGAWVVVLRHSSLLKTQMEVVKNLSDKVIFVRADGKVVMLEKQPLGQETVRYVLRDVALNLVPLSAFDVRDAGVGRFEDLDRVEKVRRMLTFFEKGSRGYRGYLAYLNALWSSYVANNLPEVIQVVNLSDMREKLLYQEGRFEYEVVFPVVYSYVYGQRWRTAKGRISLMMAGRISLPEGTPENPFGIRIERFEVREYVAKKTPS